MNPSFPLGLELTALSLVANLPEDGSISSAELCPSEQHSYSCLKFVYENRWVAGRAYYSNGNTEGIIAITGAKLTHAGLQQLKKGPKLYYVCARHTGGEIVWFEYPGPVGGLTPELPELLKALSQLLLKIPLIKEVSIKTNSGVEVGAITLKVTGAAEPNLQVGGKPGYMYTP